MQTSSSPPSSDAAGETFLWVILGRKVNGIRPAAHWKVAATEHLQREKKIEEPFSPPSKISTNSETATLSIFLTWSMCHSSSQAQAMLGS